jgi:hypothetical protein
MQEENNIIIKYFTKITFSVIIYYNSIIEIKETLLKEEFL